MMMKPESKRPISIEDLLRLKRAERPPAEFWNEFDRALRAKQLAALVEKRPWWQSLPRVFAGFKRYSLPIGASAVVAVTLFSFRNYYGSNAPRHDSGVSETPAAVAMAAMPAPAAREVQSEAAAVSVSSTFAADHTSANLVADSAPVAPVATLASDATTPGELSQMIPTIGTGSNGPATEELSPSARAIAANLASVRGTEPMLTATLLSSTGGAETRAASRIAIEPLHQIASPTERRRSNLLTAMVSMASFETPVRTTERSSLRPSQDELYDRIHRFDARGAGLMMKF